MQDTFTERKIIGYFVQWKWSREEGKLSPTDPAVKELACNSDQ